MCILLILCSNIKYIFNIEINSPMFFFVFICWFPQDLIHHHIVFLRVIVGNNSKKFCKDLIETLDNKVSEILEEIKDCLVENPTQCEHWVVIVNESLEENDDESGFVMVSHSTLKQMTDDIFMRLDNLQR